MFKRILIANRGEIAVRIVRACREMGIESVAVFSDVDRRALHVRKADYAYHIGPAAGDRVIPELREDSRCRAAHRAPKRSIPGTDFFPRTPNFARACERRDQVRRADRGVHGNDG